MYRSRLIDGLALNLTASPAEHVGDAGSSERCQWLGAEVACVLRKIESVIAAAQTLDEKRRRVDEMLRELEAIRSHLLTAAASSNVTTTASLSVSHN